MSANWSRSLSCLLATVVLAVAMAGRASAQARTPASRPAPVFVVPMKGPLHYRAAAAELARIFRSAMVQRPAAIVLEISSPGGRRDAAFEIARLVGDVEVTNVTAYVSGEHGGAFGSAVFPLLACRRVFLAPGSAISLQVTAQETGDPADAPLEPRQVSLLQAWAAQARLPWTPLQQWFADGGLMGRPEAAGEAAATPSPGTQRAALAPAPPQPAADPLSGERPLRARRAADLEAVLQEIGVSGGRVITWPDPVDRANQAMRRVSRLADDLVKSVNASIAAAREADPRAHRYELQDISHEAAVGTIVVPSSQGYRGTGYVTTDRVALHNLFADGGASWRAYTDRCISLVRDAINGNRRLAVLVAQNPELDIDRKELDESHATLGAWLATLRAERGLPGPPQDQ